jgi:hypothetical protein
MLLAFCTNFLPIFYDSASPGSQQVGRDVGRLGGMKGTPARHPILTAEQRRKRARKAENEGSAKVRKKFSRRTSATKPDRREISLPFRLCRGSSRRRKSGLCFWTIFAADTAR